MDGTMLLDGGGRLTIREDGPRVRLEARRGPGEGIYKVWLRGSRGRMLLGTLAPEGVGLSLVRTVSLQSLERCGCWPIVGGELVQTRAANRPDAPWQSISAPPAQLRDPLLRRCAAGTAGLLFRSRGEGFALAAPYDPQKPFPLTVLFCLAGVEEVGGRSCAVFLFDREGRPECFGLS